MQPGKRGEQAKNQLILAAITQFGKDGSHATTRDIAAAAGQNIAAISYYFSGKDELYLACAQWIADYLNEQFAPYAKQAEQLLQQPNADHARLHQLIHQACYHLMRLMTTNETLHISRFISREQLAPTAAYPLIHRQVIAPLHRYFTRVVARLTGHNADDLNIILHTHALVGEILAFRLSRATLLLCTGWQDFDEQKTRQVYQIVASHIDLILQGLSSQQQPTHHKAG